MTGLAEAFHGIRLALEVAKVTFAIGGSWASTTHGEPRQTNDIDFVAAFVPRNLDVFLDALGTGFYYDRDTAHEALRLARPFNVIHRRLAFKFDFFPVHNEHGAAEMDRRQYISIGALAPEPVPVVSAEDTVLAKLQWYRAGGEVSQQQWRDIQGVLRMESDRLDNAYLDAWARKLGVTQLLHRAREEAVES